MTARELELSGDGTKDFAVAADELMDAIDLASDQDQMTWLTSNGKRIAAIVSVGDAEFLETLYSADSARAVITRPDGTQTERTWGSEPERRPWQEAGSGWQSRHPLAGMERRSRHPLDDAAMHEEFNAEMERRSRAAGET